MPIIYTDDEIAAFLGERKQLQHDWRTRVRLRPKRGHSEFDLAVAGSAGNDFRLIFRTSKINSLDFSVILAVDQGANQLFRLLRHNGRGHEHTNSIEGATFYDFHIHRATARYQDIGAHEDAYAEAEYSDYAGALDFMVRNGNFTVESDDQLNLF